VVVDAEVEARVVLVAVDAQRRACLPRLSPPARSPASIAAINRSASGRLAPAAYAATVASSTSVPTSMLPATLKSSNARWPHASMQCLPV
jgi:hypothetical protein